MIITGLDGKEYKWNFKKSIQKDSNKSKLHVTARDLLREIFPFDIICENVTLPGSKRMGRDSTLYADLYLPTRKLMVEVNGQQHSKYTPFYHKDKYSFYKGLSRDRDKADWCKLNDINFVCLEFDDVQNWKDKLLGR